MFTVRMVLDFNVVKFMRELIGMIEVRDIG
jgi:hypothetical protein